MQKTKVGIIGCGNISPAYLGTGPKFEILDFVACADLDMDRAKNRAAEYNVPRACTPAELLSDPEIDIVLNLTIPRVHAQVALETLNAGKHAYAEKPFAVTHEDGQKVIDLAKEKGLRVGCAPDTFLGQRVYVPGGHARGYVRAQPVQDAGKYCAGMFHYVKFPLSF